MRDDLFPHFFILRMASGTFSPTPAEIERELLTRLQKVVLEKLLASDLEHGVQDVPGLAIDFVLSMEEEFRSGYGGIEGARNGDEGEV